MKRGNNNVNVGTKNRKRRREETMNNEEREKREVIKGRKKVRKYKE
jgi:hypothetical protein